jgi:transposase
LAVRGLGCPVRFVLTAGQKGDAPQAATLLEDAPAEFVMAATAYDADHIRNAAAEQGAEAVIPNNPSRSLKCPLDEHLYAQRHLVECCISKLKQFHPGDRVPWCSWRRGTAFAGKGRAGQLAIAGRLTVGSSLNGAMVSSVM